MLKTKENYVCIAQATKRGYVPLTVFPGCADLSYVTSKTRRGRVQDNADVSPTLTRNSGGHIHVFEERERSEMNTQYAIRKLSTLECFRLMGGKDEDYEKIKRMGVSNSQIYSICGNGLVTTHVRDIMEHLYKALDDNNYECTDERILREHPEFAVH